MMMLNKCLNLSQFKLTDNKENKLNYYLHAAKGATKHHWQVCLKLRQLKIEINN
jgi:hypothetical protein